MEETASGDTSPLLEELLMMIVALLPLRDLLQLRCTSKWWNNILKNPCYHDIRPSLFQEFASAVVVYLKTKHRDEGIRVERCAGGAVLLHNDGWTLSCADRDVYVMQPAAISLKQLPQFESPKRLQVFVKGITVGDKTDQYTVFVCSMEGALRMRFALWYGLGSRHEAKATTGATFLQLGDRCLDFMCKRWTQHSTQHGALNRGLCSTSWPLRGYDQQQGGAPLPIYCDVLQFG